ncbi:hypothetical protein QTL95_21900 [Rhizobium sp. S152]|uniref:hypothetical protein n=1 Tax=Rhizobium sp. S152 TaxID=3055038 RepID=UPI0025AA1DD0|nr:hypothetical protein [Rhizobium sp. S152]MDM9628556.1 hypothetical protein [Rhizobium sp. S152]
MEPASFRQAFFDTVQELTDFADDIAPEETIYWSAEYIARGTQWYHFNGYGRPDETDSIGQAFDLSTHSMTDVDARLMSLAFLDFQDNQLITAYTGERCHSAHVASSMLSPSTRSAPEVISVEVERRQRLAGGVERQARTTFMFVGFERADDAALVPQGVRLATSREFISPLWYRDRIRLVRTEEAASHRVVREA